MNQQVPSRFEAISFFLKSHLLIIHRWWKECLTSIPIHPQIKNNKNTSMPIEVKAQLWNQVSSAEFSLTAGKVQNLRAACRLLNGLEIPAGEVFSFWKHLGRTTKAKGFVSGRELRSGCLVPSLGGGLCQLSGLLHSAALKAGLTVVERHKHSRTLPNSPVFPELDATVFWNYVDLRFKAPFAWRLETHLTSNELVISIRVLTETAHKKIDPLSIENNLPKRLSANGDCLTCNTHSCFRHLTATNNHSINGSHSAWLLDRHWPEFNNWCQQNFHKGDHWMTPLNGHWWKKNNYKCAVEKHDIYKT